MTMLERIARAIAESDASETDTLYYSYDQSPGGYQAIAIAAVRAMREPTDEMFAAGNSTTAAAFLPAHDVWKAMIDAILSEIPEMER